MVQNYMREIASIILRACIFSSISNMGRLTSIAARVNTHSQLAGCVSGFVGKRDPELFAARDAADRVVCRHDGSLT